MAITIRDVAEAAGVSPMAVSSVLHGKGGNVRIGAAKAEMIREAAEKLRYQPNHLARSFRNKRTHTVALVFEDFQRVSDTTGYFSHLLNGVMSATFSADYSLTICPKLIKNSSNGIVFDGRFDGIVWCVPDVSLETKRAIETSPLPIVAVHYPGESLGAPTFCCDNAQGLQLAVDHLVELGHKRIGFALDVSSRRSVEAAVRIECFIAAGNKHDLGLSESDVMVWDHEGEDLPSYWNSSSKRHTALICFSESHAVSLLGAAQRYGISVPEDLSIVGFDSTPFCETTTPRLTAVSQPVEQMAFEATKRLLSAIEGEPLGSEAFTYPCGFDVRASTACPSSHC